MSLQVGKLMAVLGLDEKPLQQGTDVALDRLAQATEQAARVAGDRAGDLLGDGIAQGVESTDVDLESMLPDDSSLDAVGLAKGALVGGALFIGISSALDQGAAGDKMAASLGLSGDQAEEAGRVAGSLYANAYGSSMEEVNTAVSSVISTLGDLGVTGEASIERVSVKALDFATTFGQDVSEAVMQAGVLVRNGLATDVDHAMDLMTRGMQEVPVAMRGDVFPVIDEYSTHLAGLGFTGEEAFGLIAEAAKGGTYEIDKVPDALKELAIRATDGSTTTSDAFALMGLSASEMADEFVVGGGQARDALDMTIDRLLAMTDPAEQAEAAVALFGTPVEDLAVSTIPAFLRRLDSMGEGLDGVEGAADRMGEQLNNNAKTAVTGLTRSLESALLPSITLVAEKVTPLVEAFASLPPPMQLLIVAGTGVAAMQDNLVSKGSSLITMLKGASLTTVGLTAAAAGGLTAWAMWTEALEKARQEAQALADRQRESTLGVDAEDASVARLREQYTLLAGGVNEAVAEYDGMTRVMGRVLPQERERAEFLERYIAENQELAGEIERTVLQSERLASQYGISEDSALGWLISQQELGQEFHTGQEALDGYALAMDEANGLTHEQVRLQEDVTAALQEHQDQLRAMVDPIFAMIDATEAHADAQARLDEIRASGTATTAELDEATVSLWEASLGQEDAANRLSTALATNQIEAGDLRDMFDRLTLSEAMSAAEAKRAQRSIDEAMAAAQQWDTFDPHMTLFLDSAAASLSLSEMLKQAGQLQAMIGGSLAGDQSDLPAKVKDPDDRAADRAPRPRRVERTTIRVGTRDVEAEISRRQVRQARGS